ncbi:amino acid ABC transporter substrate-binding protein [Achromobacter denitrificans]|uniref:ABC transporter substrate-binding protein n=1 Tax=Achromobacter denitrificans TaxID=32002 RepID=UPI000F51140E|nr:ABC transporter substrate-binding protein [Achromobacter denitrificans]MDX3878449.1 ABC transporter substrate-binding protein [Achromobacter sp.]MBV2159192.1 ABC transporter substrate-binding protein [Achromobacter denitrificans]QCS66513.1 amino acid ABC transporter substrate-binding protein [Achromobacter denitrificans]WFC66028.1 amino acid ABC transporter substrate-binding protein [Achromobacter denitrificans]GFN25763.1 ABC transporter substrate-binding protein [Achromobacter denitrifican
MKTWSPAASGLLALCALFATSAHAADPDTFKIGGVVSLSGTYGIFGEDMRKGVTIAIEQRGGKVLGKPIQVTWEDDETKPQPAVQKTTRLISDGSQMIFGAVSSASTLAIMNIAKQRKIPHLVTMSADDKITVPGGSRYTFRTSNTLGMEQRMALAYTKEQKLKRIYGVTADYQATRDSWEWYRREAEKAGIEIVGADFPPLGNRDYSSIADKIARSNADGVALFMTGSDAVTMVKQAGQIELGKTRKIFGPVIADETMAAGVGPTSVGVQSGVRYHFTVENDANKAFVEAFRKKYNEFPSAAAGEAYDGMSWWLDVVDKTGTWDREKWVEAFAGSVRENSVEGKKSMRACDHQAMQNGLWGVVEAGKPPQPAYVMDIVRVFPPDQVFEACAG